jgi:DNA polymerase delta subunit 1
MKRTGGFQKQANTAGGGAAQTNKRAKFTEDYDEFGGGGYEEEDFGMLDDSYYEQKVEGIEEAENQEITSGKWIRPRDVAWETSQPLLVHWLDLDMISGSPMDRNPAGGEVVGSKEGPVPVIRMYGVTPDGNSVMTCVHGFTPYLYAALVGVEDIPKSALGSIRSILDQKVISPFFLLFFGYRLIIILIF